MRCYCCSSLSYSHCCEPILLKQQTAGSPEALMRSRFTAYCLQKYQYIVDTYSENERAGITVEDIAQSASDTRWFALNINSTDTTAQIVEFTAFYYEKSKTGILHESSTFVLENSEWRYSTGIIHDNTGMIKIGRNDPCPCLSNKKFKQCCSRIR
ncbi:YchJ family protein [Alteromonas lipotrueiana]|uniref:YchJ family protein n=1 Tax=Alteromonas lipotrueiana TaxID=2803815 RepID=UPI001C4661A3|nr:YchJ family metal-binding protein [Alteromonas lipotrueiana]